MIKPDTQIRRIILEDPRFADSRETLLAFKSRVDAPLSRVAIRPLRKHVGVLNKSGRRRSASFWASRLPNETTFIRFGAILRGSKLCCISWNDITPHRCPISA